MPYYGMSQLLISLLPSKKLLNQLMEFMELMVFMGMNKNIP